MSLIFDTIGNGLVIGMIYAVIAIGLTLIFGILKIVNFAHGEFYMLGSYAYVLTVSILGLDPWLALISSFVLTGAVAVLCERLLMTPLYAMGAKDSFRDEYAIIVTFGLSLMLMNAVVQIVGPNSINAQGLVGGSVLNIGFMVITAQRLAIFIISFVVLGLLLCFVYFTKFGKKIQAVAQNRFGATLCGISPSKISMAVFGIGGGLAGLSGGLLAPIYSAEPQVGTLLVAKAFVIVVLGGMGSIPGTIIGALLLGLVEDFGAVYISTSYQNVFGFILMIVILAVRPQGLMGEKAREV